MTRNVLALVMAVGAAAMLTAQAGPQPAGGGRAGGPQAGAPAQGARGGGGGRAGGGGGGAPAAPGFGTTDTLFSMPEAGQGSGAADPTAEQFAASAEAQAIVANARRIAGADLANEVARFCT
ncbi:MAG: hypothetical protein IT181_02740 [Acidobacteria bacterium]|nr:hypothetical protein [Acidobacteriota bacterium]